MQHSHTTQGSYGAHWRFGFAHKLYTLLIFSLGLLASCAPGPNTNSAFLITPTQGIGYSPRLGSTVSDNSFLLPHDRLKREDSPYDLYLLPAYSVAVCRATQEVLSVWIDKQFEVNYLTTEGVGLGSNLAFATQRLGDPSSQGLDQFGQDILEYRYTGTPDSTMTLGFDEQDRVNIITLVRDKECLLAS